MWSPRTWRPYLSRLLKPRPESARTGRRGERIAAAELQRRGYQILTRNWRTRVGEVDLVARHDRVIVLVEVRSSRRLPHAALLQRIDSRKRRQLERLLAYALRIRLGRGAPLRVDAVFVDLRAHTPVVFVRRNVLSRPNGR